MDFIPFFINNHHRYTVSCTLYFALLPFCQTLYVSYDGLEVFFVYSLLDSMWMQNNSVCIVSAAVLFRELGRVPCHGTASAQVTTVTESGAPHEEVIVPHDNAILSSIQCHACNIDSPTIIPVLQVLIYIEGCKGGKLVRQSFTIFSLEMFHCCAPTADRIHPHIPSIGSTGSLLIQCMFWG